MVEFSLFYFLPPPPLFTYEFPEETTYVSGGFDFAQIDNLQTFVRPDRLPPEYAFPIAFKISNGMRFHTSVRWVSDWILYLSFPTVHVSTPPLGTSALQGNPPEVIWGQIDATVEDTLLPLEVDGLRSKVPVRWRIKGNIAILPVVSSKSDFSYLPITFGIGRKVGSYFLSVGGSVSRFAGEGGWEIRYVGGQIYEDTLSLEGVQNDAVLSLQFAEEDVGRYYYRFKMEPTVLYNLGLRLGRKFGPLTVSLGGEAYRALNLSFSDSLYYNYVSEMSGPWIRKGFFSNDLYAEYSADSDTVYLKGSAVVALTRDTVRRESGTVTGSPTFPIEGGTYPFLTLSYTRENLYASGKISGEGVWVFGRMGEEYGGFAGLDLRLVGRRLSRWQVGAFYSSESFVFSFRISRAFGRIRYPYVDFTVPVITKEVYAYSFGISFAWKLE